MAFNADEFKSSLRSTLKVPVKTELPVRPVVQAAAKSALTVPLARPSFATAGSSPATLAPDAPTAIKLLDPRQTVSVRPAFARAGQEVSIYGGPVVGLAHDIAARTIETIPSVALKLLANVRSVLKGGTPEVVKTPFDVSRIGIANTEKPELVASKLTQDQASAKVAELKRQGKVAIAKPNAETLFNEEGGENVMDVFVQPPEQTVTSSGQRAMDKLSELEAKYPDRTATNIGLASLEPIFDILDATIVGDMGIALARAGLKATAFNPALEKALQQYGLKGTSLTGDALTNEIKRKFAQKAKVLVEAGDHAGLNELGEATNALIVNLSGKGIPKLSRLGQVIQDASRLALQKPRYGFTLKHPLYPEIAPERPVGSLPGTVEEEGQGPAMGLSVRRVRKVGGAEPSKPAVSGKVPAVFEGFDDVTTKLLDTLRYHTTVSRQYIQDLTNRSDLKQPERDLFRSLLADEGDTVNVSEFANRVKSELLPLKENPHFDDAKYESITLPPNLRGPVANYKERIWESPIKTKAGSVHYADYGATGDDVPLTPQNYFAHTRMEDLPKALKGFTPNNEMQSWEHPVEPTVDYDKGTTRRIVELQSDLFQRGRLDNEAPQYTDKEQSDLDNILKTRAAFGEDSPEWPKLTKEAEELMNVVDARAKKERIPLEPYRNTWHERVIREEVRQAAKDGKTKLQFPTGETAMKIEGLGETANWSHFVDGEEERLTPQDLRVGMEATDHNNDWIVTEVLGNGKFKAVPRNQMNEGVAQDIVDGNKIDPRTRSLEETFDISGDVDTESPIYKFYEKTVGRYLKNKYGGKRVVDEQGVPWWEVDVKPEHGKSPVEAFGFAGGFQQDDQGNVTYNPLTGLLGIAGGTIGSRILRELSPELMRAVGKGAKPSELEKILTEGGIRPEIAARVALRLVVGMKQDDIATVMAQEAAAKNVPDEAPKVGLPTEEESYSIMADQTKEWKYDLHTSAKETSAVDDNLTAVFADLKGVTAEDLDTAFTPEDLENARAHYETALETLMDHPGRALMKYVSRESGDLPEVRSRSMDEKIGTKGQNLKDTRGDWEKNGDAIFQDLVGQERSQQGDLVTAQEMVDDYKDAKARVAEIQQSFRDIRKSIQLQKAKDTFVESSKRVLAAEVAKNVRALKNVVEAAERAGYRKGVKAGNKKVADLVARLKSRRTQITAIQKRYDLTDSQMQKIRDARDPRFMDKDEFATFMQDLETKAHVEDRKNQEKVIIRAIIEEKGLKKPENLRVAMELPKLSEMSLEQLQEFDNALSKFEQDDIFLGPRMIQTIVNTDLGDVKTIREIRERLAAQGGYDVKELEDVRSTWTDKISYDSSLADRNPLYKWMVTEYVAKNMENEQTLLALRRKVDELAKASRASRIRGLADKLVPQDKEVFEWLSTPESEQALYARERKMTPQELEYAEFVKAWYRKARDILIEKGTLKKWREAYVTHITRSFLEQWKDDGFIKAVRNTWINLTDSRVDFDAIGDTGEILGLEKFFKFSLAREGGMTPSQNVARVIMTYAGSFYKKQALDQIIPKLEAYVFSLQRPQGPGVPKDPTGLGIDGKLKQFVRRWVNNKKGRQMEIFIEQGGKVDGAIRAFRTFLAFMDLGFNIITGAASAVGGEMSNFVGLSSKEFAVGTKRSFTKKGIDFLQQYPGVVGEPPFERLASAANDAGDTLSAGAFYLFSELAYRQKGQFFLGSLTAEEWNTGVISFKRQAEIKLEMARFHPVDGMDSIAGATPFGKLAMMYKTWAEPFLFTARRNVQRIMSKFKNAKTAEEKAKVMAGKEFKELFKLTVGSLGVYLFWNTVFGPDDPNDTSITAKLRRRIAQELSTSLSSLDPVTWTQVRSYEFVKNLAVAIEDLFTLQTYKSTGDGYKEGDLQAPRELAKLFTPAIVRQFLPATPHPASGNVFTPTPTATPKSGSTKANPALKGLERLKKLNASQTSSPALNRLKDLKKRLKLQ